MRCSTRSPEWWPCRVLTALKPSRSQTPITARSPRATIAATCRSSWRRLGSPVSGSVSASPLVPGRRRGASPVVDAGGDAVDVDVPQPVVALRGEPERVPVGARARRRGRRPRVGDAAQPGRLGRAERLGRHPGRRPAGRSPRSAGRRRSPGRPAPSCRRSRARALSPPLVEQSGRLRADRSPDRRAPPGGPPRSRRRRGCSAAAGRPAVGDVPGQVGGDVAEHPQAAVAVAAVVQGDGVAQPDARGGEGLLAGCPAVGADLRGPARSRPARGRGS